MISVEEKSRCCGCSACSQRCPQKCIKMMPDNEGFLYPLIDSSRCIGCGLCEKVCPFMFHEHEHDPLKVIAAKCFNENVRKKSSSGGVFTVIAESILKDGGIVFGVRWNSEWEAEHAYTETLEGLNFFRSSKYVQSKIENSYKQAEIFLKLGRKVLFSGTPCQIAGLKTYLINDYDNLLTVECVCHSVPSPFVWKQYLFDFLHKNGKCKEDLLSINFRNKDTGWARYSFRALFKDGTTISVSHDVFPWMKGFINGLYTRPSCRECHVKYKNSMSDITLGDLWGINELIPDHNDDKGCNSVIVHTKKALDFINNLQFDILADLDIKTIIRYNPAISRSSRESSRKKVFYKLLEEGYSVISIIEDLTKVSILTRVIYKFKSLLNYL